MRYLQNRKYLQHCLLDSAAPKKRAKHVAFTKRCVYRFPPVGNKKLCCVCQLDENQIFFSKDKIECLAVPVARKACESSQQVLTDFNEPVNQKAEEGLWKLK